MELAIRDATLDSLPDISRALLARIREICEHFQILSLTRQIEACENLLQQDQLIDVAVLGQFKAGKSSFLNSLIGKPVLPVGVIPVTTTITRLYQGQTEEIRRTMDELHGELKQLMDNGERSQSIG